MKEGFFMKIKEITEKIDILAPQELAYTWDNVGLICGNEENELSGILLTLDLDLGIIDEAKMLGANLIIGHHPILFEKTNKITPSSSDGQIITALIENKISYFAAHTNLDIAKNGLNDLMAEKIGLKNVRILEHINESEGIGRIGDAKMPVTLTELAKITKEAFNAPFVRICGDTKKTLSKIAVNTGGGTSLIESAINENADVLITGDYKYSQMRNCVAYGLNIIDVGHYNTEITCCELFYNYLKGEYGDTIKIYITEKNTNVMQFV